MNYKPLTCYEQEYLSSKARFEALPRALSSLRLFALKVASQRYPRGSYRPVHQFIKYIIQPSQIFEVHLSTAYVEIRERAITEEFCIYRFPVVNLFIISNLIHKSLVPLHRLH